MKTFTQDYNVMEGISQLTTDTETRVAIDIPLQKMFDELITFVSFPDAI